MKSKNISIATLNLWRYYQWEERQSKIIRLFKDYKSDIIALQEVQINRSFSNKSQAENLAKALDYPHFIFAPTMIKKNQTSKSGKANVKATHGLAVLSKFPILSYESIRLTQHELDPEPRNIVLAKIDTGDRIIDICNVHFSNNNEWADKHMRETLLICQDRNIRPIVLGDFNLYSVNEYLDRLTNYHISSIEFEYTSYPKDKGSLDYIISPFKFQDFICQEDTVSDHRALIAKLILN